MGNSESVEDRAKAFAEQHGDKYGWGLTHSMYVAGMASFAQSETASLRAENERLKILAERAYPDLKESGICSRHRYEYPAECSICYPDLPALIQGHVEVNAGLVSELATKMRALEEMEQDNDRQANALWEVQDWSKAYPLKPFPEPTKEDWANIAKVLHAAGFSLDCISASNMRHVITKVQEIAQTALTKDEEKRDGIRRTTD